MSICIYQHPMYSFLQIYQSKISRTRYTFSHSIFSCYVLVLCIFNDAVVYVKQVTHPILLRTSSYSRLWYKPDMMFAVPKAYVKIDFHCPYAGNSPESEVLTDIFTRLLMDYLNECGMMWRTIFAYISFGVPLAFFYIRCFLDEMSMLLYVLL